VPKVLRRRELVTNTPTALVAGLPTTVRVRFAPNQVAPKRMEAVNGRLFGSSTNFSRFSRTNNGEWWTATFTPPCRVNYSNATLEIQGRDAEAHQGSRGVLDGDPSTVAFVTSEGAAFGEAHWQGHEGGATTFRIPVRNPIFTGLVEKTEILGRTSTAPQTAAYVLKNRRSDSPADQSWLVSADVITDVGTTPAGSFGSCLGVTWSIDPTGIGPDGRSLLLSSVGLNVNGVWHAGGGRVSATPSSSTPVGVYRVFVTARTATGGLSRRFEARFEVVQPVVIPDWPGHLP
jgi:hypothetical protein